MLGLKLTPQFLAQQGSLLFENNFQSENLAITETPEGIAFKEMQTFDDEEKAPNVGFETGSISWGKGDGFGGVSTWGINDVDPIDGDYDGKLTISTVSTINARPYLSGAQTNELGKLYRFAFKYKVISGTPVLYKINTGGGLVTVNFRLSGEGEIIHYYIADGTSSFIMYWDGRVLWNTQLDDISRKEVNAEGVQEAFNWFVSDGDTYAEAAAKVAGYCYFDNDSDNGAIYGLLYNKYAKLLLNIDPQIIYHIPTESELTDLKRQGGNNIKEIGTTHWLTALGKDKFDFTALGGGYRDDSGTFSTIKANATFIASDIDKVLKLYHENNNADLVAVDDSEFHAIRAINEVQFNKFGSLPPLFKTKWDDQTTDLEIVVVGDSIPGNEGGATANTDAAHLPPSMRNANWVYGLWNEIVSNKPICDRIDSERDSSDVFTKTGSWAEIDGSGASKLNTTPTSDSGEYSIFATTYESNDLTAKVEFEFVADTYEKINIVHGLHPDGAEAKVIIAEGNGKMLASVDKATWIEANDFAVSQLRYTEDNFITTGYAYHERHRRIWLKKVDGVTGTLNISFERTDSDSSKYMYFWGTEKWSGLTTIITNLGRGGRNTELLNRNISDIFDRNPDLVVYSMPLNNEDDELNADVQIDYRNYFFGSVDHENYRYARSFFVKSNEYQDTPVIIFMPSGRSSHWSGNTAVIDDSPDVTPYSKFYTMHDYLLNNAINSNMKVIDLYRYILQEAQNIGFTNERGLNIGYFTSDGVHLSQTGQNLYVKYLKGIFGV